MSYLTKIKQGLKGLRSRRFPTEEGHVVRLRAALLRGGRLVKINGIVASIAPSVAGARVVVMAALSVGSLGFTANALADTTISVAGQPDQTQNSGLVSVIDHSAAGLNAPAGPSPTNQGIWVRDNGATGVTGVTIDVDKVHADNAGIHVGQYSGTGPITITNQSVISDSAQAVWVDPVAATAGDITLNLGNATAQSQAIHISAGNTGNQTINISGNVSAATDTAIYVGSVITSGDLTITQAPTGTITSGTRATPTDLFMSGGGDGIQLAGSVGGTGNMRTTSITTGNLDVTGNGVNLANNINRVDGATKVTTGNITAGGEGVAIESNDNGDYYPIDVKTGNLTTGGTGVTVNQSGTGSISVETGNVDAGMRNVTAVNGFQNAGGYGVRLDSDPHGATTAGVGGADWILKTGNVTVTDRSTGNFAGTGVGLGTISGGGNGNTTVTTGNIQAGTGVIYNRNGTGAVSLTTGDITATTGNGIQYGTNIVQNDLKIKTGDITAAGYGITGDTSTGSGVTAITTGNITAGSDGINVIHSGTGAATINTGDVTSTGGRGVGLIDDAASFNPDATIGGVTVTVGNVSSVGNSIDVTAQVKQTPTVITANGTVTATSGQGFVLSQSNTGVGAGDVTVTANKAVTASATGINVSTSGLGDTTVQANDAVTGTAGYGVIVSKSGDGKAVIDTQGLVTARTGISLSTNGNGNGMIHAADVVNATAGTAIQVTSFGNGNLSVAADKGVTATGNGIDLGGSTNGGTNTGSVTINSGGDIKAGGIGINADTGPNTTTTTINVADMDTGSTGVNWINSGTKPFTFTSTGTITSAGIGINLTTDSATQNSSTDSETIINVNNITTPNNTAINVNSNAANGTTINTNGAINTPATNDLAGDGMRVVEGTGPLTVNVAKTSTITSYNNTMDLTNNSTKGTTVNVDGKLVSTALQGGYDGVIWVWNTPGTTTVNINDGSTVQAAGSSGFAMTDNNGNSVVTVGNAAVTGGFRMGAGNDALTFNNTDMTNVGTLDGGGGSTGGDVLTLNAINHFTRNLQTAGQEIENWDAVNLNGGKADLVGTMTTGTFTLGNDASGNPASLSIGAGHVGDVLTVTGNYVGAGGIINLDTDASTHTADTLNVGGNVSGVTGLSLNDLTPTNATSDLKDINVVNVTGTSPNNAFVLAEGPAVMGGHAYLLQQGDSAYNLDNTVDTTTAKNWYLNLQPCPAGGLSSTNGTTLGCKTNDTLILDGSKTITGNFEGGGGNNILKVLGNASVGGIVAGGDPGADSSAPLNGSDLIIINTTGSVGGVQGNLGNDVIYVVGSSTVNGNVEGNEGSNQIRIGGMGALSDGTTPTTDVVTVKGDVLGGDSAATDGNNQIWVLGGSHVTGNVIGGNGNDAIVLNGTTAQIDGSINGGSGNDTIAVMAGTVSGDVIGGTGSNNISLSGGTVGGNVYGGVGSGDASGNGDGTNIITLSGATVTGNIYAGSAGDTIVLNSGSAAKVLGGVGNDTITLAGAHIAGAINAGEGNNTVMLNSGTASSVTTGAGNDQITLAGAAISGAINAGDGNNTVMLNSGTASSVTTGAGNDQITLAGAHISGAINAGDGTNTVVLNSGTASSVTTGAGKDQITLAGAAIAGAINSGAGDDTINLVSGTVAGGVNAGAGADTVNVTGETFTLGNTKLDGGAMGEGNMLNLNAVNQTLTTPQSNLVNFDTVNVTNSTLTVNGGDSLTTTQLNLLNSTIVAHNGFTVNGNLSLDPSTIDMQNGVAGGVFTVRGNYAAVGSGNKLKIDVDFANDKADELHVGGTVSGTTDLNVKDVTPANASANGKDVVVAISDTSGGVNAKNFALTSGPITNGIWDYNIANGATPDTVVLHGTVNVLGATYSATAAALSDTFGSLPTMEQRVGQRQWLAKGDGDLFNGVWVRFNADHSTTTPESSTVNYSTQNDAWGAQVGVDFNLLENQQGRITAGITGQYNSMDATVNTANGQGGIRADGGGGGVNLTWNGAQGQYIDLQGQYNQIRANISTDRTGTTMHDMSADSKSISLEVGNRFVISADGKHALVPQAQVSFDQLRPDDFTDKQGVAVSLGTQETAVARVGLAYEFRPTPVDVLQPNKNDQMFYAIFNVLQDMSPTYTSQVQGMTLDAKSERTWGQLGLGGSLEVSKNVLLYGQVSYSQSLRYLDNARNNDVDGTVGIRMKF